MSDVIDFNDIKNKVKDKDVEKFEEYIYALYYQMAEGKLNIYEMNDKVNEYVKNNNISQEKFLNIQKKFLDKISKEYGIDMKSVEEQMKSMGIDTNTFGFSGGEIDYDKVANELRFEEKYKGKLEKKLLNNMVIKNSKNDLKIILDNENVILFSEKKIELVDGELNDFLCSYKKKFNDEAIKITLCENIKTYEF
ncbi:DUF3867 family protein [Clostridium grantii]|uniref:DUF3867 domain-containing protein n=1 Tax=Clostridium grantii DSM 8605 TaxID=1121316 RepID=A0A1M5UCP3_9CLOT|nr:DUF3867 family protein [Clostridium grantii]SHH60678.1 Protein of unknown function [Clostridium grantii DSM 8605]